jgi:sulfur-oxidizing protein SoxZ
MSDPMRIRAQAAGDKVNVRVLVSHEMETGQRKDSAGKTVSVSKNPFLQFSFKGGKAGEKIAVSWVDNKGDKRTDEATIA